MNVVAGFACVDFSTLNPRRKDLQDVGVCSDNPQGNTLRGTLPTISMVGPACVDFSTLKPAEKGRAKGCREGCRCRGRLRVRRFLDLKRQMDGRTGCQTVQGYTAPAHSRLSANSTVRSACVDFSTLHPSREDVQDGGESRF